MSTTSPGLAQAVVKGGRIVLAAQEYPECLNVLTECAYTPWLYWSVVQFVMPRATQLTTDGRFTNSSLITEFPSLSNGDLTQSPFTVRYRIDPKAVWSDGTPISCADFAFTRNATLNTKSLSASSPQPPPMSLVSNIDCSDPHTAVVQFSAPSAEWPDVFGGATGVILEKAAFPKEKDQTKVDLSKEMQNGIPFSGGPWKLQSWSHDQTVLVPNANYWAHKPNLDQVTIVPRTLPSTIEADDLFAGTVDAIFPQWDASLAPLLQGFAGSRGVKARLDPGVGWGIEGLWMNLAKPPFDDPTVRQALFWAVDRASIVRKLLGTQDPSQMGCAVVAYPGGFWCNVKPFAQFHYDLKRVDQVMTAGGYAKDPAGFWAKDGKEVAFEYATTLKPLRTATQGLLKEGLTTAGFNLALKAYDAPVLFTTKLPGGDFQLAEFAMGETLGGTGSPSPSTTSFLACGAAVVPTAANGYLESNYFGWCNQQATAAMRESDSELDPTRRRELLDQVYQAEGQDFAPGLPLYVLPNLTMWRSDKIAGPIGQWNGTSYGGFFNIDEWYCARQGACS